MLFDQHYKIRYSFRWRQSAVMDLRAISSKKDFADISTLLLWTSLLKGSFSVPADIILPSINLLANHAKDVEEVSKDTDYNAQYARITYAKIVSQYVTSKYAQGCIFSENKKWKPAGDATVSSLISYILAHWDATISSVPHVLNRNMTLSQWKRSMWRRKLLRKWNRKKIMIGEAYCSNQQN